MKLGTVTYNMFKDMELPALIATCEKVGLEAVELRTTHKHGVEPTLTAAQREEVKKMFMGRKVRLLSLGTVCEFQSPEAPVVQKNIEECKAFVKLAHDIGAIGVKVRPNGYPRSAPPAVINQQIGRALQPCGAFAADYGIGIWVEVHGAGTQEPRNIREIMEACGHKSVGICWNSNPTDVTGGSVKPAFDLIGKWIRNCHITELWNPQYPYRELFTLLKQSGYQGYTLAEIQDNPQPERFMQYYRALWMELSR